MAVLLSPLGGAAAQFFDSNGNPLSGGQVFTYQAGTSTPQATYTTSAGNIQHSNPIILDAAGRVPTGEIWLTDGVSYKFVTKDANSVLIGTYDNIEGINPQLYAQDILYTYPGTGAVQETVQTRLAQYVSVKDFGAVGDGVADDTTAVSNAISSNRNVYFPPGTYLVTSAIIKSNLTNCTLYGAGASVSSIKASSSSSFSNSMIGFVDCSNIYVSNLTFNQNNNSSFTATWPLFIALTSNKISVQSCSFINVTYIGLAFNQVNDFVIANNYLEHNTAVATTNYNINVSSLTTNVSRRGIVKNNILLRSSNIVQGRDIIIDGNIASLSKYGANFVTGGDSGFVYGGYNVINNICNSGSGVDADGINVAGMEIGGINVIVSNNTCNQNGGVGIAMLARDSIISNNTCLGNGQNVGATDIYRSGILMGYADSTVGAYRCTISGNRCGDDGTGRQKYGYYEQGSALNNIELMANNFAGNTTAQTYIQSTNGFYQTNNWTSWTPTVTSVTGTITTVGAVTAKYRLEPKTVYFIVSATITTNGTGGSAINITLPPIQGGISNSNQACYGREDGITGKALTGIILYGTQGINVTFYDATYPGADGAVIQIQGFYEIP